MRLISSKASQAMMKVCEKRILPLIGVLIIYLFFILFFFWGGGGIGLR